VGWSARFGLAAAGLAAALIVAAISIGFFAAAAFLGLKAAGMSAPGAAVIVGVGGLILAALLGYVARRSLRPAGARRAAARSGNVVNDAAADLGMLIAQQITSSTRAHPFTTMAAALAAGLAVGAIPELRKALTALFKR
jgi:hypothetical protein